jgi:hypothetical protein
MGTIDTGILLLLVKKRDSRFGPHPNPASRRHQSAFPASVRPSQLWLVDAAFTSPRISFRWFN